MHFANTDDVANSEVFVTLCMSKHLKSTQKPYENVNLQQPKRSHIVNRWIVNYFSWYLSWEETLNWGFFQQEIKAV